MIVGCYTLDLYCDFCSKFDKQMRNDFAQFTGQTERGCFREAKKRGWKHYRAQEKVKCPRCVKYGR